MVLQKKKLNINEISENPPIHTLAFKNINLFDVSEKIFKVQKFSNQRMKKKTTTES